MALFNTVAVPPTGPFKKYASNPVLATGGVLVENIAYDPVSAKYWAPYTNIANGDLGIMWSTDLISWTIDNPSLIAVLNNSASPHLMLYNGTWYMYYSKVPSGFANKIYVATCSTPNGTYTLDEANPLLSPIGSGWEKDRVLEPFVFRHADGRFIMFYMGDANNSFAQETIGYAYSNSPLGPFTRYAGNPVLGAGAAGTYDEGGAADPSLYVLNGTYYMFYSYTNKPPTLGGVGNAGHIGLATSTDMNTWTRRGPMITASRNSGSFDEWGTVRGAVILKDDIYYYLFSGSAPGSPYYKAGLATMPATAPTSFV